MDKDILFLMVGRSHQPTFYVWSNPLDKFVTLNGNQRWADWPSFLNDLRHDLASKPWLESREVRKKIRAYTEACPEYIKNPRPVGSAPPQKNHWIGLSLTVVMLAGFAWLIGYGIWNEALRPVLGSMGLVEYKKPIVRKYERFLATVGTCREDKRLTAGNGSSEIPSFQLFTCPNGEERIWARNVEVVREVDNDRWLIE